MSEKSEPVGYALTRGQGFHITFENGVTVSVQFGPANYCNNREMQGIIEFYDTPIRRSEMKLDSPNAEIAVITRGGHFITAEVLEKAGLGDKGDGQVAGWISPDNLAKIIAVCVGMRIY